MSATTRSAVFSPWVRRGVLLVAFLGCAGMLGTMLFGKKLLAPAAGTNDSYGAGPLGHRLLAETSERLGYFVAQNRGSRFDTTQSPLLFLEPETRGRSGGFEHRLGDAYDARSAAGLPMMIAMPKWMLVPSQTGIPTLTPTTAAFDVFEELGMPADIARSEHEGPRMLTGVLGSFEVEVPSLQVFRSVGPYDEVLLEDPEGAVVLRTPEGALIVSDPDFFHNFTFHLADHAALFATLLQNMEIEDTLVIDETFHGHGHQFSLGEVLGEFPAILLVAHALFVLLLVVTLGATRFGPPRQSAPVAHGPAEGIAVAASVLAEGQSFRRLCQEYVQEILADLHDRLGLPERTPLRDRPTQIDRVAQHRGLLPRAADLQQRAAMITNKTLSQGWNVVREAHAFRSALLGPASGPASTTTYEQTTSPTSPEPERDAA